jgi:hypothetical protein
MTEQQIQHVKRVIKRFYRRNIATRQECIDTVAMVRRHYRRMTMDDCMSALYGQLCSGPHNVRHCIEDA